MREIRKLIKEMLYVLLVIKFLIKILRFILDDF
jgi:hypothetical protein